MHVHTRAPAHKSPAPASWQPGPRGWPGGAAPPEATGGFTVALLLIKSAARAGAGGGGAGWALIPGPPDVTWERAARAAGTATTSRRPGRASAREGLCSAGIKGRRNVSTLLIGNRVLLSGRLVYSGSGIRTQGRL